MDFLNSKNVPLMLKPTETFTRSIVVKKVSQGDEDSCHFEYCSMLNEISIYYPQMKSRKMVIQTLIHEYIHYLQSPTWFKRYYNMGHDYVSHPYEKEIDQFRKRL